MRQIDPNNKRGSDFFVEALNTSRKVFWYVLLFSAASNILMLAMPIYSLQVLDRVATSQSMETLTMLSVLVVFLLMVYGLFQALRSMVLIRLGQWMDTKLAARLVASSVATAAVVPHAGGAQALRDLTQLKQFLTGQGLSALFDAPWSIIFLIVIFMIHPVPFLITFVGAIILLLAAWLNERAVKSSLNRANELNIAAMGHVDRASRNAEVVEAMGMMQAVTARWQVINAEVAEGQATASHRSSIITSAARSIRMIQQAAIMGSGAYLVIHTQMTFGGVIACSILAGRALAPFEAAMAAWTSIATARQSHDRLIKSLDQAPLREETISLPAPRGIIQVEKVMFAPHGQKMPILKGVSFNLSPGEILGVIGPSAAGKSTLAKLMVGVWKPQSGAVRLDGADVYSWKRNEFGQHLGYLPQSVELFDGTVRDNIARLQNDVPDEAVVRAAQLAGAHEMILKLPDGYDTKIGGNSGGLSAGQRQRVGLARAFFGNPKLMVLDEPNSNLDESGEAALQQALRNAKALGITVVVIAHRPSVLSAVDKVLMLRDGMVADFGPAADVLRKYVRPANAPANAQAAPVGQQIRQAPAAPQQQPQAAAPNIPNAPTQAAAPQPDVKLNPVNLSMGTKAGDVTAEEAEDKASDKPATKAKKSNAKTGAAKKKSTAKAKAKKTSPNDDSTGGAS